MFFSGLP
jgi:SIT family siderophore-iron:H+ symporter-like MFS transporter